MCTLSYIPTRDGYTLTHNRDERMDRTTSDYIKRRELKGQVIYYPEDEEAFGTWIACSTKGQSVCLMNGGSEQYERKDEYRHSRGLVVLDSFRYSSIKEFFREYNFHNLEPFTLLAINRNEFYKITHNEEDNSIEEVDPSKTHIWSSTTLYTPEVRQKREKWFQRWLDNNPPLQPDDIRHFHKTAGEGDTENDLIMSRWGKLKTLSVTQVVAKGGGVNMIYDDFIHNNSDSISFFARP